MIPSLLLTIGLLATSAPTTSGDWPQWRGANRDGKSSETGLSLVWPKAGPNVVWENNNVGTGYGSVAVVGDRVYLLGGKDNKPGSAEFIRCLNAADGKPVWTTPLDTAAGNFDAGWGGGPRATPTVADGSVYCLGATGDIVCVSAKDGAKIWSKNLVKDFGGAIPSWGYSESVLVDGENVICTPGKKTGMIALNAKTGETVWSCSEFKDGAGYSSIVPTEVDGVRIYVQQTMASALAVRAKDGKLMFRTGEIGRFIAVIPSPIVADGYAFFTAGYGAGCECYKLASDGNGGVQATKVYSKFRTFENHHGGVIQVGDYIYGHSERGGWTCFAFKNATDEPVWKSGKLGKGSISFADGHLFCYEEKNKGTELAVIKATPEAWSEVARMKLPQNSLTDKKNGAVWAHPVIANGKLYLRDFDLLFCFDIKKP